MANRSIKKLLITFALIAALVSLECSSALGDGATNSKQSNSDNVRHRKTSIKIKLPRHREPAASEPSSQANTGAETSPKQEAPSPKDQQRSTASEPGQESSGRKADSSNDTNETGAASLATRTTPKESFEQNTSTTSTSSNQDRDDATADTGRASQQGLTTPSVSTEAQQQAESRPQEGIIVFPDERSTTASGERGQQEEPKQDARETKEEPAETQSNLSTSDRDLPRGDNVSSGQVLAPENSESRANQTGSTVPSEEKKTTSDQALPVGGHAGQVLAPGDNESRTSQTGSTVSGEEQAVTTSRPSTVESSPPSDDSTKSDQPEQAAASTTETENEPVASSENQEQPFDDHWRNYESESGATSADQSDDGESSSPVLENVEETYIDESDPNDPKRVHYVKQVKSSTGPDGVSYSHSESKTSNSIGANPHLYNKHHSSSSQQVSSSSSSYYNNGANYQPNYAPRRPRKPKRRNPNRNHYGNQANKNRYTTYSPADGYNTVPMRAQYPGSALHNNYNPVLRMPRIPQVSGSGMYPMAIFPPVPALSHAPPMPDAWQHLANRGAGFGFAYPPSNPMYNNYPSYQFVAEKGMPYAQGTRQRKLARRQLEQQFDSPLDEAPMYFF